MSIIIVDYDAGNLRSVQKAFEQVGAHAKISPEAADIAAAPALVLPGVGAFGQCVHHLQKRGLIEPLRDYLKTGRPFLGICVGYQLLFESSDEFGHAKGLGHFAGTNHRFNFPTGAGQKIPHMGWNQIHFAKPGRLYEGVPNETDFYFVHSFYPDPSDKSIVATTTDYGNSFASSVEQGNIFATQFHPEKSQAAGLKVLQNFASIAAQP